MADVYYRWFPGDYLRDTADLSASEDGFYRRLLDFYYSEERLPADRDRLYRIARASCPEEKHAVDFVVGRFFMPDGDRLINQRAERELDARRKFLEEQTRKSHLGHEARWGKKMPGGMPAGMPAGNAGACPEDALPSPSPSPLASASPSENSEEHKARRRGKNPPRAFVVPETIPPETWAAFEEHRKALRKPMTDRARSLIVSKLERLGGNPVEILEQSIRKGWQDVFPVREDGAPLSRGRSPAEPKGWAGLRALREEEGRG
jgi:uncharacterized protein YdaU (DUF1376 family)